MGAGDVARDGKAEPGAALILVARVVEPHERLEHLLAHAGWNARTIIIDRDGEPAVIAMAGERDRAGEARRVRHQVGEAAFEGGRTHRDDRMAMEDDRRLVAMALGIRAQLLEKS